MKERRWPSLPHQRMPLPSQHLFCLMQSCREQLGGVVCQTHHTCAGTLGAEGGGGGWRGRGGRTRGVEGAKEQGRWERGEERQSVRVGKVDGRCEGKGRERKGRE